MDLKRLAREKGTNLKRVAERCGVPPSTLYAISRGDTNFGNVGIDTAIKVANALGMTVEELYTGEAPGASKDSEISPDESRLLRMFRMMDAKGRCAMLEQAEFQLAKHPKNKADSLGA